jgi:hypothetical protein
MNRYYSSQWGRFLSPDPYGGSVKLGSPQTWNRYAYVNGDPINGNDPFGLCTIEYTALLTGPSAQCNTAAATAWGTPTSGWDPSNPSSYGGIDTFSTLSGVALSQSTTITQVDLGSEGENDFEQVESGDFWLNVAEECETLTCVQNVINLSGGAISPLPSGVTIQFASSWDALFGGIFPFLIEGTVKEPSLDQPPQPFLGGSLVPPFAPNPTQPTCEKGYHPDPTGGVGNYQCVANPGSPPPKPPIAVMPPLRILTAPRPIGAPLGE